MTQGEPRDQQREPEMTPKIPRELEAHLGIMGPTGSLPSLNKKNDFLLLIWNHVKDTESVKTGAPIPHHPDETDLPFYPRKTAAKRQRETPLHFPLSHLPPSPEVTALTRSRTDVRRLLPGYIRTDS